MLLISNDYRLPEELRGTILEKIMHAKMHELAGAKIKLPALSIRDALEGAPEVRSLKSALKTRHPAVIAEIKKASPSAGLIRKDFEPVEIAREYQKAGAAAISVITEVHHFRGNLEILARLRWNTNLPLLRKDFIIDGYQVLEARHAGADAVLLIAALLDASALTSLRKEVEEHGMDALIEVHNETELRRALDSGATLVGVNSRDLRTFEVSFDVFFNLARLFPKDVIAVAESGIQNADDIRRLAEVGYRGFLVGEHLMQAASPGAALAELLQRRSAARRSA
jgi:indole-3-glycerol phosphate synthase